jgi:hypothetical protein
MNMGALYRDGLLGRDPKVEGNFGPSLARLARGNWYAIPGVVDSRRGISVERARIVLIILITSAITVAVVGVAFMIIGTVYVSNAKAEESARTPPCYGNAPCLIESQGLGQQGIEGMWYIATGEWLLGCAAVPAVPASVLWAYERMGD